MNDTTLIRLPGSRPRRAASIVALVAALALVAGCERGDALAEEPPPPSGLPSVAERLTWEPVAAADVAAVVTLPGEVTLPPQGMYEVGPTIAGRIERWHVSTGDHVTLESPLADVVSTELADLESASRELTRVIRERRRILRKQKEHVQAGMQSVQSLYETQIALSEARARKAALDRQLEARKKLGAKAEEGGMQWSWVAPVEGIVQEITCAPGTVQSPASRCLRIVDTTQSELRVPIPERFLPRVYAELRARWLPAWERDPNRALEMRLVRTEPLVDPKTRTLAHYFLPVDPDDPRAEGWLTPGATGRVTVLTPAEPDTVRVPRLAVVEIDGEPTVFVASKESADATGEAEARTVTVVGHFEGDPIVRCERLKPGDRVVTRGAFLLKSIQLLAEE